MTEVKVRMPNLPTLRPDPVALARLSAVMGEAVRRITAAAQEFGRAAGRALSGLTVSANSPVVVARLEARFYVRAAMDPAYASPDALHGLVVRLMRGEEPGLVFLSLPHRAEVAAAAIRGWGEHR